MITHLRDRFGEDDFRVVLKSMLDDMDWDSLRQICKVKKKYLKHFQKGGFQLKAQHIDRARNVIWEDSEEDNYNLLFNFWYKKRDDLMSIMDVLFETEKIDVETGAEETDGKRELLEESFESLIGCLKDREGLYFLFFSPITFSREEELRLAESRNKQSSKNDIVATDMKEKIVKDEKLRTEIRKLKGQFREANRENKKLLVDNDHIKEEFNKLRNELENTKITESKYKEQIAEQQNIENERIYRLESEIERQKKDLIEKRDEIDRLGVELEQKKAGLIRLKEEKDAIEKEFNRRVVDVMNRLNLTEIIQSLNEPDVVKECLLSIVRQPITDETNPIELKPVDIDSFWNRLVRIESDTIKKLGDITLGSVSDHDFIELWPELSDELMDVKYSLRARAVMIDYVSEILRNFYDPDKYITAQSTVVRTVLSPVTEEKGIFGKELDYLGLNPIIIKRLNPENINTVGDLAGKRESDLLKIKYFGRKDLKQVIESLKVNGLHLGMKVPNSK